MIGISHDGVGDTGGLPFLLTAVSLGLTAVNHPAPGSRTSVELQSTSRLIAPKLVD